MLIVFGAILKHIRLDYNQNGETALPAFAQDYRAEIGGHAALQALSASRSCIKVALISAAGDGYEAAYILPKLRSEGLSTSAVTRSEHHATGARIDIMRGGQIEKTHIALSASQFIMNTQVPDEVLGPQSVVLIQNEVPAEQSMILARRAKELGTTTIYHHALARPIDEYDLDAFDYAIADEAHKSFFAGKKAKTMLWLNKNFETTIESAEINEVISVPRLPVKDSSGTEDAFCGTFAAACHDKMPLIQSVKRASIAAALCACKVGSYKAMPFGADIEKVMKEIG